jgi:hypothetical protein
MMPPPDKPKWKDRSGHGKRNEQQTGNHRWPIDRHSTVLDANGDRKRKEKAPRKTCCNYSDIKERYPPQRDTGADAPQESRSAEQDDSVLLRPKEFCGKVDDHAKQGRSDKRDGKSFAKWPRNI